MFARDKPTPDSASCLNAWTNHLNSTASPSSTLRLALQREVPVVIMPTATPHTHKCPLRRFRWPFLKPLYGTAQIRYTVIVVLQVRLLCSLFHDASTHYSSSFANNNIFIILLEADWGLHVCMSETLSISYCLFDCVCVCLRACVCVSGRGDSRARDWHRRAPGAVGRRPEEPAAGEPTYIRSNHLELHFTIRFTLWRDHIEMSSVVNVDPL